MRPQTIQIYLPFGDPQGIRVAEITTRTVQVFDVPRNETAAFFETPESDLEWKSIKAGNESGRYALENGTAGSRPHTPAPLEAECEEIFDTIDTLLSTLGFPLFKPLATRAPKPTDLLVFCKGRGAEAKGVYSSDGLTVFKGSRCAAKPTNKATPPSLHARRAKLIEDGTLVLESEVPVFARDTLFKTPSGAADVVMFRSANGWTEWRTEDGTKLNDATGRSGGQGEDKA
jgi:hypothetical protein